MWYSTCHNQEQRRGSCASSVSVWEETNTGHCHPKEYASTAEKPLLNSCQLLIQNRVKLTELELELNI